MWQAVLVDFDDTIADTSHLRQRRDEARRSHDWAEYFRLVGRAKPVLDSRGEPIHSLFDLLRRRNIAHAIVTNSPSAAVDAWFNAHDLVQPPTFGAVGKPSAKGIRAASLQLGFDSSRHTVLLVDDDFRGALAALRADMWSVTVRDESDINEPPDYYAPTVDGILEGDSLLHLVGDEDRLGLPACLIVTDGQCPTAVAGRYRPEDQAGLSLRLREKPTHWPESMKDLASALCQALVEAKTIESPVVTAIPPGKAGSSRFTHLLEGVRRRTGFEVQANALRFTREVKKQTWVHSAQQRADNVHDSMAAAAGLDGRWVIVIDDVSTTGSTMAEACAALRRAGAMAAAAVLAKTAYEQPGPLGKWLPLKLRQMESRPRRRDSSSTPARVNCSACGEDYPIRWKMCGVCGTSNPNPMP